MKALFFAMIVTAAGQAPAGQAPAPQDESAPYRTGTRVVEITVSATKGGEKPVSDLRAQDLRLFDNGKEQSIASFEKVGTNGNADGNAQPAAGRATHHPKRLYVIVLDALNTPWTDEIYARVGVSQMLKKLPPGDRIAVFGLDGNLHLLHDFSNDYGSLRAAVDNYAGTQPPDAVPAWDPYPAAVGKAFDVSTYPFHSRYPYDQPYPFDSSAPADSKYPFDRQYPFELNNAFAFDVENGVSSPEAYAVDAAASDPRTAAWFNVSSAGAFADFETTNRILYTLEALTRIAQLTRSYAGPKSILWVSAGFPTEFEAYLGGLPVPEYFHVQTAQAMRELQIANAVLEPISPQGLDWSHIDSMKELADQTGGKVFYNSNDVSGLVRAARDDMREGYVLTFVPKTYQADGSVHRLSIQTLRPGVQLRYRTVYAADSVGEATMRPVTYSTGGSQGPMVTRVTTAGGNAVIAPNSWVEIKGSNLAPVGDSRTWRLSDVDNNQLPTQLDGVSVTMNGENAYVYSISPGQVRVLTPPDLAPGPVQLKVTTGGNSTTYTAQAQ